MVEPTQIGTLAEAKAWLESLSPRSTVELSSDLFAAPMVEAAFDVAFGAGVKVPLAKIKIDVPNATLTGTGRVLGEDGSKLTVTFSEPKGLCARLNLKPPSSVRWMLPLSLLEIPLCELEAVFTPDLDLELIDLDLVGELRPGASGESPIPVAIALPNYPGGYWRLRSSAKSIGSLGPDALEALAGGSAEAQALVELLSEELAKFRLTGFEAAFDPTTGDCAVIRIQMEYGADWKFFEGRFQLKKIGFELTAFEPTTAAILQAGLSAEMEAAGLPFEVGGRYPDLTVYGQLPPGRKLSIAKAFEAFTIPVPEEFPDVEISTLDFFFFIAAKKFEFRLGIEDPIELIGEAKLDFFNFDLSVDYSNGIAVAGDLYSGLSFGQTELRLGGSYSQSGVQLEGAARGIKIKDVVKALREDFEIESVPEPLERLTLELLEAKLDTGAETFSFKCSGTTEIADVKVAFAPTINLAWGNNGYTVDFGGKLILETAERTYEFEVDFESSPNASSIAAAYRGQLTLSDLADALEFETGAIPDDLDLELEEVDLLYDFKTGGLAIGAKSKAYGRAVLVSILPNNVREFFFVLDTDQEYSLSDLPLVGEELAEIEDISISGLEAIVATQTTDKKAVELVNREIDLLKKQLKAEYPTLPVAGTKGKLVLAAALRIGGEESPLEIALVGGTPEPPPPAGAPGVAPAESTTWIDIEKSFGPISIRRVGVMYQSETQVLWFELDAGLLLGPLSLSLNGLGIGSPLSSFEPNFDLRGLGVAYRQPPLEVAGGLTNLSPPGSNLVEFEGGIVVGTPKFKLQALGYYGNTGGFTSMFIFGTLDYPLGGPPAFFVTGLALGFGYNSSLRLPEIDEVAAFPLVAALPGSSAKQTEIFGPNPTPLDVVDYMRNTKPPWVQPKADSLWFAAGITFTSFELVEGQALVVVETGDELVIALIGTARAQFPQAKTKPPSVYANVELYILVRLAPDQGVFSAQALLAKSSYVLDRSCVLTGGFAFFVWFGKNPNRGDFVLTLGGYNPGFIPPKHYPTVPAVGFRWSVDNTITLRGSVYLTVTPAVLMAGGRLEAVYQYEELRAWFSAHADVLIRWKPFWIEADIGIVIGVSYTIDLWFTTSTLSVELGCNLELWGPPTGGAVRVNWYVISFTIRFGAGKGGAEQLRGWREFESLLPNAGAGKVAGFQPLALAPIDGLVPGPEGGPWAVRAGTFAFEVQTPIPATTAKVGEVGLQGQPFAVHPLGWKNVSSACAVAITAGGKDLTSTFAVEPILRNVPASLWGSPPETGGRPTVPDPEKQLVRNQLVGVSLRVHPPTLGATAGPVDVEANLYGTDLELAGAVLPLSEAAKPSGEAASGGEQTAAIIADPATGIAAPATRATRAALYEALRGAGNAAAARNEPLDRFAAEVDGAFATEPLVVK